ncbi:MAG: threonine synthase [Candidatus Alcyoniella australis]|nr:threonine synthase [Candidatus Alcyoniella australis]
MSEPYSRLHCIGCDKSYDATDVRYRCDCGDLLEVRHDLQRIKHDFPDLRALFDQRLSAVDPPYSSGVWRYRELILPDLPPEQIVTKPEGNTNLYRSPKLSAAFDTQRLFLKHEGENPTLSFKDRGMTAGVSWAHHLGMKVVACASTGDTSAAMAAYAAGVEGMQGVVFLPHEKVSPEQLAQAITYGARTLALRTDFDGCMRLVQQICEQHPIYLLNSMNSFRIEGQKAIGIETVQQLGWRVPDWFVIPVGNAGNVSALGKGLREAYELGLIDRLPRIAGIQAAAADPLYRSYLSGFEEKIHVTAEPTLASAIRIGAPVSHDKAVKVVQQFDGVMAKVTEAELMDAKAAADRCGVAVCPNSGVALAGLRKLRAEGTIHDDQSVVVILTAHGAKFSGVSVDYHTGALPGLTPQVSNAPLVLEPELGLIARELGLDS